MDSTKSQTELWASGARNWQIQEATFKPLYLEIIKTINFGNRISLLDIGCGTGFFLTLLNGLNCDLAGIDSSKNAISIAEKNLPVGKFITSEMEKLPFSDNSFDLVIANNSFQYSISFVETLSEIYRVLKSKGSVIISLWDNPQKADSYSYFKIFYSLTNQNFGNPIPFNLSQVGQIETLLINAGFIVGDRKEINCPRIYPNLEVALRGILSSGPAHNAIKKNTLKKVESQVIEAIKPFEQENGAYKLNNSFFFIDGIKAE